MPITDKCEECARLKAEVEYARKSYLKQQAVNRDFASRGRATKGGLRRLERNKVEAVYRVHLGTDHKDEGYRVNPSDITIVMRAAGKVRKWKRSGDQPPARWDGWKAERAL